MTHESSHLIKLTHPLHAQTRHNLYDALTHHHHHHAASTEILSENHLSDTLYETGKALQGRNIFQTASTNTRVHGASTARSPSTSIRTTRSKKDHHTTNPRVFLHSFCLTFKVRRMALRKHRPWPRFLRRPLAPSRKEVMSYSGSHLRPSPSHRLGTWLDRRTTQVST